MKLLEQAIIEKGKVLPGNVLKVGSFLNNQLDVSLLSKLGEEIYYHFKDKGVNKILTIEASGIALAVLTAEKFGCNVVFAKKSKTLNVSGGVYTAKCFSYTHKVENNLLVPEEFLGKGDNVLIVDDFLAHGEAVNACIEIIEKSGATLKGVAIAIEKGFQGAGDKLRANGIDLLSLAIVDKMEEGNISFR